MKNLAASNAFRSHRLVALGQGSHRNQQGHACRLSLIRDPRFGATVNDIVVESGNARYQDLMDRFVRGDDVPHELVRQAWQNTTQPDTLWDVPIYEEFWLMDAGGALVRTRKCRFARFHPT
jgi:hypothetical protein